MAKRLTTFVLAVFVLAFGYAGTVSLPSWLLVCRVTGTEMAPSECCHPKSANAPEPPSLSNAMCCDIKAVPERAEIPVLSGTTLELPVVTLPTIALVLPPVIKKTGGYVARFSEAAPRAPPLTSASPRGPPFV